MIIVVQFSNKIEVMLNGSKQARLKGIHKNFIVDYRNAKYQGQISEYERLPDGVGMLLDIDYQMFISQWEQGTVKGPCVAVMPQGPLFYGHIQAGRPQGWNAYQLSRFKFVYGLLDNSAQNVFFINCQLTKTLTTVRIASQQIHQFFKKYDKKHQNDQFDGFQDLLGPIFSPKNMAIGTQIPYKSQQDKWQIISKILRQSIPAQYRNYKSFLKHQFNSKTTNKQARVQIIDTQQYTELKYKKTGILCRIDENAPNQNRINFLGYYDRYEDRSDVYRKSKVSIATEIQQYCQGHLISYEKDRPTHCKQNLQNYFRKSVHFINKFITLSSFRSIFRLFEDIYLTIEGEISTKNAQNLLQNGPLAPRIDQDILQPRQKSPTTEQFRNIELSSVRNDIYSRLKRNKNSVSDFNYDDSRISKLTYNDKNSRMTSHFGQSIHERYSPNRLQEKSYLQALNQKRGNDYFKYPQETSKNKSRYNYSIDRQQLGQNKSRKKYTYMPSENRMQRNMNRIKSTLILDENQYTNDFDFQNQNKTNYVQYQRPSQSYTNQGHFNDSIGTLAINYQKIKTQLSYSKKPYNKRQAQRRVSPYQYSGTPTSRSPSKHNYVKSPLASPGGMSSKSKRQWR